MSLIRYSHSMIGPFTMLILMTPCLWLGCAQQAEQSEAHASTDADSNEAQRFQVVQSEAYRTVPAPATPAPDEQNGSIPKPASKMKAMGAVSESSPFQDRARDELVADLKQLEPAKEEAPSPSEHRANGEISSFRLDELNSQVPPPPQATRAKKLPRAWKRDLPQPSPLPEHEIVELPEADDLVFHIPDAPPIPDPKPSTFIGGDFSARADATAEAMQLGDRAGGRADPELGSSPESRRISQQTIESLRARDSARSWLEDRRSLDELTFQPARGYWSNTYIPGDPGLRFLESRLTEAGQDLPHGLSRRPRPPFDPPSHAALGVHLHADRSRVEGRGRVLLQVGLQATERFGGRRTAMNLAVVLHLPSELTSETSEMLRAFLFGLAEERDFEDRFTLIISGRPGALALDSGEFRHGPLTVLTEQLASHEPLPGSTLSLEAAFDRAIDIVAETDDPSAPLGSSSLILVSAGPLAATPHLESQVHSAAVAGLPVTTVGLGTQIDSVQLERLALLGQGRRHRLTSADRARSVVQQELEAVARAIARAVRLNIRLAPGVELVDVLDSYRLDTFAAQRVKAVEQSVDLRLARRLGITADRGDDEDGIQIVVPAFYAGDHHTILLDVVAGPGPVAEVTARFKDLVHLDNGVAKAHLALTRGEPKANAFHQAVIIDHLAHEVRQALLSSADYLQQGNPTAARQQLTDTRDLLAGLAIEMPSMAGHSTLANGRTMVQRFLKLMPMDLPPAAELLLDESLRYASRLQTRPAPSSSGR